MQVVTIIWILMLQILVDITGYCSERVAEWKREGLAFRGYAGISSSGPSNESIPSPSGV
jgi:hypothetical protein